MPFAARLGPLHPFQGLYLGRHSPLSAASKVVP
jgi:hypothetical protein